MLTAVNIGAYLSSRLYSFPHSASYYKQGGEVMEKETAKRKPLRNKILMKLAGLYLRRKMKGRGWQIFALVTAFFALLSLCIAIRHKMK